MIRRLQYFKQFLNFFWLRPENALMCTLRAEAYSKTLANIGSKTLDVSCGDGVFTFTTLGGELSETVDMFRGLDISRRREENFDVFNHLNSDYRISIIKNPEFKFSVGTDHKVNLINKARLLGFYDDFLVHDNNCRFPFFNDSFDFIYSNSAYWVKNIDAHLTDLLRILRPGGKLVLQLKTSNIKNYTAFHYGQQVMGADFCKIIDAGRLSTWEGLASKAGYLRLLEQQHNCQITDVFPVYGGLIAKIWDIGLRPLFNPLVRLANSANEFERSIAKREWCDIMYELFSHYIYNYKVNDDDAIEWTFVAKKKG